MRKTEKLKSLFRGHNVILVAGAHDGLGAKLAEQAGFDAVWASGLEISTSYAVPDANILTMSQYLERSCEMNDAIGIPVIADCDTGFGNSSNVIHMVKKYESAGIAAVCIEDKHFPKVNSFIPGRQELAPISEFMGKILAAKNAQQDADFMVIARVEALIAGWGMEEALKRANAYVDAGADAILIHSKVATSREIADFSREWKDRAPLVVVPTTYYKAGAAELARSGVKMVIYANQGIRAAIIAMKEAFSAIISQGSASALEERITTMKEVFDLQGMPEMKEQELIFAKTGEAVTAIIPAAADHLQEHSMKNIFSDVPISMLDINGKPLLQRQAEVLNRCRIYDINCIAGYKKESLDVGGVKIIVNDKFQDTGILSSLMCAADKFSGRTLIIYGDVFFDHIIINRLLESREDITIIADSTYDSKHYSPKRKIDLMVAGEKKEKTKRSLHKDTLGMVKKIGAGVKSKEAHFEFPGIMLLSDKGAKVIKDAYSGKKKHYDFNRSSLADLLQDIIISGKKVFCLEVNSGWTEIHSLGDYKSVCAMTK